MFCLAGAQPLGGAGQTDDGAPLPPPALARPGHHCRNPPGWAPHYPSVQALLHLHQAPHTGGNVGGCPRHVLPVLCQGILWVSVYSVVLYCTVFCTVLYHGHGLLLGITAQHYNCIFLTKKQGEGSLIKFLV